MSEIDAVRLESEVYPVVKIHAFGEIKNGGTPSSDEANWDGDIPFITPPDLNGLDSKSVASVGRTITELGLKQGSNLVENGVIISGRAPVGYVGVVVTPSAFNQGCKAICTAQNHRYVAYALTASKSNLQVLANGTTFSEISSTALANYAIPLPPLEIQRRIADYLDRETAEIDAAVADLDRYVELLESRKIEKLKELIFADNEGEFPLIPVQLLFRKISSGSTPKGEHFYAESGNGVPWVTTSELREKIITETKKNVTPQAVEKVSGLVVFPRDTILIAMYGATIGRFGRLGVNATSNQACCALIDPIGIDPEFFYYSLYVHSRELVKQAFGGGQPNINQNTIRRFRAPVPSLAKQKEIAREMKIMVAETEDIIAESTKLRDLLLKRRSVLITEVVTGRKQV